MKQAKFITLTTAVFFAIGAFVINISSCNTDPCKSVYCKNGGSCREAVCKCPDGYVGPFCEEKLTDRLIGTYYGKIRCNGSVAADANVIIVPGPDNKTVRFYELQPQGQIPTSEYIIIVKEDNTCVLEQQTVNGITIWGNGYIEAAKYFHFYYTRTDNTGTTSTCIFDATKQVK